MFQPQLMPPPPAPRCPGVPATWSYPSVPLGRLLVDAVVDFPDRPALRLANGAQLTHVEFAQVVERVTMALGTRGATRLVAIGCRATTQVILAQAAFRAGCALVLGVDRTSIRERLDQVPSFDPDRDVVAGPLRVLRQAGVATSAMLVDDLDDRLLATHRSSRTATIRRTARRIAGFGPRSDVPSLAAIVEAPIQGTMPAVGPAAIAAVVHHADPEPDGPGTWREFPHSALLAATFQLRLWLPDMQAGSERVAAVAADSVPGVVAGPLLAALTAAELVVAAGPEDALRTATIGSAGGDTWRSLAATRRRGRAAGAALRIGIVLADGPDDQLDAQDVRRVVGLTDGARLRHAWLAPEAAGPVTAQPVYGRIGPLPGARPLPDVELARVGSRLHARGPQFAEPHGWHDVTDHVAGSPDDAAPAAPARAASP